MDIDLVELANLVDTRVAVDKLEGMPRVFELAILHLRQDSGNKVVVRILDIETTLLQVA